MPPLLVQQTAQRFEDDLGCVRLGDESMDAGAGERTDALPSAAHEEIAAPTPCAVLSES